MVPASCALELREPTTDYGDQPAMMDEPKPAVRTESDIAPEPDPQGESSDVDMDYMASEIFFDELLEVFNTTEYPFPTGSTQP